MDDVLAMVGDQHALEGAVEHRGRLAQAAFLQAQRLLLCGQAPQVTAFEHIEHAAGEHNEQRALAELPEVGAIVVLQQPMQQRVAEQQPEHGECEIAEAEPQQMLVHLQNRSPVLHEGPARRDTQRPERPCKRHNDRWIFNELRHAFLAVGHPSAGSRRRR